MHFNYLKSLRNIFPVPYYISILVQRLPIGLKNMFKNCSLSFILYVTILGISFMCQIFLFTFPKNILHSKCYYLKTLGTVDFENCRSAQLGARRILPASSTLNQNL